MGQQMKQALRRQYQYRDIVWLLPQLKRHAAAQDWEQAATLANDILLLQPEERGTLETLLGVYIDCGRVSEGQDALERLAQFCGMNAYSYILSARLAFIEGDWKRAEQDGKRALRMGGLSPENQCLAHDILGRTAKEIGNMDCAAQHHLEAAKLASVQSERVASYSNYLLDLHYRTETAGDILREARKYNDFFIAIQPFSHEQHAEHEKLRIGYISPDLCAHIVAYFSWVMFQSYDRAGFEVYCYANCEEDAISQTFATLSGHWCNIRSMTSGEAARRIYEDEIDILVDLSGHTKGSCLPVLAFKPAPVQISGIGYMSTTGLSAVDYFLSDSYLDGAAALEDGFTEKLLLMPHSHFCYRPPEPGIPCAPAPCGKNGFVTFGCFNSFAKITDPMLEAWRELLAAVPASRLFLKAAVFDNVYGKQQAVNRLQQAGIPMERVIFEGYTANYLESYARVDIALDTYPYPGGGTTCDALYMGVPVITLVGERHGSRFGYSLLMNMGLEECCSASWQEYAERAAALAGNSSKLQLLHQTLRRRMKASPIMDMELYMAELEEKYRFVWSTWRHAQAGPAEVMQEVKQRSLRLLAALQCRQWDVVVQEAGRLKACGACAPKLLTAAGFAYFEKKDYGRAIYWLKQALPSDTENDAELRGMLGEAFREKMDAVQAFQEYDMALHCLEHSEQKGEAVFQNRLLILRARVALLLGKGEEAARDYLSACRIAPNEKNRCNMYSSYLLSLHCTNISDAALENAHEGYKELFRDVAVRSYTAGRQRPERLRIGYISPDFRQHVMFHFYYALLACHDAARYEIYGYRTGGARDGYTDRIEALCDHWRDLADLTHDEAANQIAADGIDILVDLAGHTSDSGLPILARKPAPVQVFGLGYMHRTGLPTIDYLLTDRWCDPETAGEKAESSADKPERPLYLTSQFCYAADQSVPEPQTAPCRKRGYVLFGVFNHYYKITDEMLHNWKVIMEQVRDSRLLLKSQVMISNSAVEAAYERLEEMGLPMDRISFEPATPDYMRRYLDVDIALDTYPYPGGGTTCDALYMGVPVISRYGSRRGSRFGLSILQSAGAGVLAVDSNAAYIERAVTLAKDADALDALHLGIRDVMRSSPLMNARSYMKELETQYERIWQKAMQKG